MTTIRVFQITSDKIDSFTRNFGRPRDCFINSLQLLGLVDSFQAINLRIQYGNIGFYPNQIVDFFNKYFNCFHIFSSYNDLNEIVKVMTYLPMGVGILSGVRFHNGDYHVFITTKNLYGDIVVLDPQQPSIFMTLDVYLNNSQEFYILKY